MADCRKKTVGKSVEKHPSKAFATGYTRVSGRAVYSLPDPVRHQEGTLPVGLQDAPQGLDLTPPECYLISYVRLKRSGFRDSLGISPEVQQEEHNYLPFENQVGSNGFTLC